MISVQNNILLTLIVALLDFVTYATDKHLLKQAYVF